MSSMIRCALLAAACAGFAPVLQASPAPTQMLEEAAPAANPEVLHLAAQAAACAVKQGVPAAGRLAVIDYTRPSDQARLWVFDLEQHKLLFQELVAHGRNSGGNFAQRFSNDTGSLESSLGLFRMLDAYSGNNGVSLRMAGLEPGVNDRALERNLVIHGAPYVSPYIAASTGRVGRSWGRPAVRKEVARPLIDALKGGQLLFAYYPDRHWLESSRFLHCGGPGPG
ncbi:MAG: murein L,D-transpeptidase catalytic domain family protein [Nevskia sp.]|nr:murein L,D-transpeptidase catalytic domain family protein [Nevskia sp.]